LFERHQSPASQAEDAGYRIGWDRSARHNRLGAGRGWGRVGPFAGSPRAISLRVRDTLTL
jgi:hypothetical protein